MHIEYRVARDFNVYDVVFDGLDENYMNYTRRADDLATRASVRIFNNACIGYNELCNLQVPGQLIYDQTAFILNWYARTNIPTCQALTDWAHSAQATLNVGCHYQAQASIADLLAKPQGFEGLPTELARYNDDAQMQQLASRALSIYERHTGGHRGLFDLSMPQQNAWVQVARAMHEILKGPRAVVVPVRQNFDVLVQGAPTAFQALRDHVFQNIGEGEGYSYYKPPGPMIQPKARLWIHIEGMGFPARYQ